MVRVQGHMTAQRYVQDIVQPYVLSLIVTPNAVFQQDNARPHTALLITVFLTANNINTLPWSSLSPDLNAIEHIWDKLDRRLRARANAPTTPNELFIALQAATPQ
jgi:hypothetical protein